MFHFPPALYLVLALLLFFVTGLPSVRADQEAPAGCDVVFGATTRGEVMEPSAGGGCNFPGGVSGGDIKVDRVIDGDTIVLSGGRRLRYIGLDAPEVGDRPQHFGPEASAFNRRLLDGRKVHLEKDVSEEDRFGRLLRFVYADGILVNAELVREGYARAKAYPPDTRYTECFAALEQEAQDAGRGMWANVSSDAG